MSDSTFRDDVEQTAENLLRNEVLACQSCLVDELLKQDDFAPAKIDGFGIDDIENLSVPEDEADEFHCWFAGSNMPGYLPDEPPHPYASKDDAIGGLGEDLDRACDEDLEALDASDDCTSNWSDKTVCIHTYQDVRDSLEAYGKQDSEPDFGYTLPGRHYFISRDTITREDLEAADCDPSDYQRVDGRQDGETQEVFEWWLVSSWLYDKLRQLGEPVIDNGYGCWWGRTCTGQGILGDGTLQDVARLICTEGGAK